MRRCTRHLLLTTVAVTVVVVMAGCSKSSSSASTASTGSAAPTTSAAPKLTGGLNVFAAASLTEAFNNAKTTLSTANPDLKIMYNFAGSQALVQQIQNGAPADVFAPADEANMKKLAGAGLVDQPRTFAKNKLQIVVAGGNPKGIKGLADLARPDLTVVLEDPSVPAGKYGKQALDAAGVKATPKSLELDVKSALNKVTSGQADAAIVYVTDVRAAGSKAAGVDIIDAQNVVATYPIAVVKAAKNPTAAKAFVDSAVNGDVQRALQAAGFAAP